MLAGRWVLVNLPTVDWVLRRLGVMLSRASPIDVDVLLRLIELETDGLEGPPLLLDVALSRKELAEDEFLDML